MLFVGSLEGYNVVLNIDGSGFIYEVLKFIRNWVRDYLCYVLGNNLVVFCLCYENFSVVKFKSKVNVR